MCCARIRRSRMPPSTLSRASSLVKRSPRHYACIRARRYVPMKSSRSARNAWPHSKFRGSSKSSMPFRSRPPGKSRNSACGKLMKPSWHLRHLRHPRHLRHLIIPGMRNALRLSVIALALLTLSSGRMTAQQAVPHPDQYFGFKIGADGELARYPKILEYFQLLAKQTNRVKYEELGKTTMGNSYPLLRISSPENLAKFDRLVEINRRLADPRGLSEAEAEKLAAEGKPFHFIHA